MKKIFLAIWAIGSLCACETIEEKVDYTYKEVPFTDVHFTDNFWLPRIETIRNVTVPFAFRKCEETHRIDNFAVAAGIKEGKFNSPYPFDDSDVYKIMEGASYLLAVKEDNGLDAYMDSLISLIGAAQERTVICIRPARSGEALFTLGPVRKGGKMSETTAMSYIM